jgi:glycosyltransferase involved in cell wall biosynthesis
MISVCIPTYNGEKYIKRQIESILCQLSDGDEIIISDDNSTDGTLNILKAFDDPRIKIHHHEKIENPYSDYYKIVFAINRNVENALRYAYGDYIFLSDQDDVWLPNRVYLSLEKLQYYDLVISDCSLIDDSENIIKKSYFNSFINPSKNLWRTFYKSSFHGCCMAFRKSVKYDCLPFPDRSIGHDTWIGLVAIKKKYNITFINIPTVLYRLHGSNISISETMNSKNDILFKIYYRFNLIKAYLLY